MRTRHRRFSIKTKIIAGVIAISLGLLGICLGLQAYLGVRIITDVLVEERQSAAMAIAHHIGAAFERDVAYLSTLVNSVFFRELAREANKRYAGLDESAIAERMKAQDRAWLMAARDAVEPVLGSPAGSRLAAVCEDMRYITELFLTDRYGGLIAASGMTTDYYQADEAWWQAAYDDGAGKIALEGVVFDLSSNALGISVAIPVSDKEHGLLGIARAVIAIAEYWGDARSSRQGQDTFVIVTDKNGLVLRYKDTLPLSTKALSDDEWSELLRRGTLVSRRGIWGDEPAFLAVREVSAPLLTQGGIAWEVIVAEPLAGLIKPYAVYLRWLAGIVVLLVALAVAAAWGIGQAVAMPARRIREVVERVAAGDLASRLTLKTGDELEDLAAVFNTMVERLARAQDEARRHVTDIERANRKLMDLTADLSRANKELMVVKEALAEKVGERTEYLIETQEAVINMMEDLQESKEAIERSSEETVRAYEELKETQRRLVQSEKMAALGRFSAGIAHEVKNPLAIMLGGMEYLSIKLATSDADLKTVLAKIREAILRADRVLQNLLRFARPAKLEAERIAPEEMLQSVLSLFGYKFPLINIEIKLDVVDKGMQISVDKNQIEQVIFNLLINAMDAMPKGGTITIRLYRESHAELVGEAKDRCVIEVRDTGTGIAKADAARLFEPFFTTKRDKGGTGLGLAVARSIVEGHDGLLTLEGEEGKGAVARIILPIVA